MRSAHAAILLLFLAVGCGNDEEAAPEETAEETSAGSEEVSWSVDGGTLESASLGFRLEAPEGWEWSGPEERGTTYVFTATKNEATVRFTVYDRKHSPTTQANALEFVEGMIPSYGAQGMSVRHISLQPRGSKMGQGFTYSFSARADNGGSASVSGYIVARGRLYQLESTAARQFDIFRNHPFIDGLAPAE
jgi:hypothetical protein